MPEQTTDTLKALAKLKEDLQAEWPSISLITALDSIDSAISLTLKACKEAVESTKTYSRVVSSTHEAMDKQEILDSFHSLSQQLSGKV